MASLTVAMVLAVNCPPQAPALGQADAFQLVQLLVGHGPGGVAADGLEDVDDGDVAVLEAARQDAAAVHEDGGDVEAEHRHHHAGEAFVAPGETDDGVVAVAAHGEFDAVGDDLAGDEAALHALVAHGDAVGDGDGGELAGGSAGFFDAALDALGLAAEGDVAGCGFVPAGGDADEGLVDLVFGEAHGVVVAAVRGAAGAFGDVAGGHAGSCPSASSTSLVLPGGRFVCLIVCRRRRVLVKGGGGVDSVACFEWETRVTEAVVPLPGDELAAERAKGGQPPVVAATSRDRGVGPFKRLVLRGATVIDGTGAPPIGPVDVIVEGGRIAAVKKVRGVRAAVEAGEGEHVIDCAGKWVTPGFVDCHAHAGVPYHAANGWVPPVDYVYKLWLAHGVTTVREMGSMNGLGWMVDQRRRSEAHEIAAPRLLAYAYFPAVNDMLKLVHTPEEGRAWLRKVKERGADGIKFFGAPPAIMEAALDECAKLGLRSGCHHAQMAVTRMNALTSAQWGLTSAEHYYGLPEALFEDRVVQDFPHDYNYSDEYFRFSVSGQMFMQGAKPGSAKWNAVMEAFLALGFTFVPTFSIYDANRDLMRARQADWHKEYTWKSMARYFVPQRGGHGSYWVRWSTQNEIEWKENYRLWMQFINEYKNRGGRVCTGSDSGFIYQIFGFGYVRELELLQEAGFHPLEVLRAATSEGAALCGIEGETGTVEAGSGRICWCMTITR